MGAIVNGFLIDHKSFVPSILVQMMHCRRKFILALKQGSPSISAQIFSYEEVITEMCRHANLSPGPQVHL